MTENVLVVAPHPDDETLGAGGTLLRLKAQGAHLHWLVMTKATEPRYSASYIARQEQQINTVRAAYPFTSFHWLRHPASTLARADSAALIDSIGTIVEEIRPQTVIVPHAGDAHDDHAATHHCVLSACKSFYMQRRGISRIMAMEILSETDAAPPTPARAFLPTVIVDISSFLDGKLKMLSLYETELQTAGPRSVHAVEYQARLNGASFGLAAAERFALIRELVV